MYQSRPHGFGLSHGQINEPMPDSGTTGFSKNVSRALQNHKVTQCQTSCSHENYHKLQYHQHPTPFLIIFGAPKSTFSNRWGDSFFLDAHPLPFPRIHWRSSLKRRLVWLGHLRWHWVQETPRFFPLKHEGSYGSLSTLSCSSWNLSDGYDEYGIGMSLGGPIV